MELPEYVSKRPVGENFRATDSEREFWFEDSNHNLQACIYDPKKIACYSGELKTVVFTKAGPSWKVGPTARVICNNDQSVHNKTLKKDAQ